MCSEKDFKELLLNLPKLSEEQKKKLIPRLKVLGIIDQEPKADTSDEEWVRRGIAQALKERGIFSGSFISEAMAARAFGGYKEKTAKAGKMLEAGANRKLNYEEKVLLAQLATTAMVKRFQGDLSLGRILRCADKLPAYFDEAFPGYLANKMAMLAIRGKSNGRSATN